MEKLQEHVTIEDLIREAGDGEIFEEFEQPAQADFVLALGWACVGLYLWMFAWAWLY